MKQEKINLKDKAQLTQLTKTYEVKECFTITGFFLIVII